jgi:DNA primase
VISDDDKNRVRQATELVGLVGERVVLRQRGREFWGCCPFHNEKTPSFKVDPVTQLYHCFGCGEGGDVFKFVMRTENVEFPDAIRMLADRAGIDLDESGGSMPRGRRTRLLEVCEQTAAFYHHQLMRVSTPEAQAARDYLASRDLGGAIPREWLLGYSPGQGLLARHLARLGYSRDEMVAANVVVEQRDKRLGDRFFERVVFPINDLQGRCIAFGGRVLPGSKSPAKYLNTAQTPLFHKRENLYAIDKAKAGITSSGMAIVVEGYTDTIAMHKVGLTNTVATLGTALSGQHIKLLRRFTERIVYLFDGDAAGLAAADKATSLIAVEQGSEGFAKVAFLVATIPDGSDPAEHCAKVGAEGMRELVARAVPLLRFSLDRRVAAGDLSTPEGRMRALDDALRVLVPVRGTLLAVDYLNYLSELFSVAYETIAAALERMPARSAPALTAAVTTATAGAVPMAATAGVAGVGAAVGVGAGAGTGASRGANSRIRALERELLVYAVRLPAVRKLLVTAFAALRFTDGLNKDIVEAMCARDDWIDEPPAELASRIADAVDGADVVLGAGHTSIDDDESALRQARLHMFSLRKAQLEDEIAALTRAWKLTPPSDKEKADQLYREITVLQQELSTVHRRWDALPKIPD